ncbi:MAG: hypothetical protein HYU64_18335 [Armatimonadetes bacterium]|nr:hypothetical protein [Armatimonadota bacterium]
MKLRKIQSEFLRPETATVGAIAGMAGGIYGLQLAQRQIEKVPVETVTLREYEKPVLVDKSIEALPAKAPVIGPDGSVVMEKVPARNVSGHGKPIVTEEIHNIEEPVGVRRHTSFIKAGKATIPVVHRYVDYKTIGTYREPHADFESGVSVLSNFLKYAFLGSAIGIIGTALSLAILDKD